MWQASRWQCPHGSESLDKFLWCATPLGWVLHDRALGKWPVLCKNAILPPLLFVSCLQHDPFSPVNLILYFWPKNNSASETCSKKRSSTSRCLSCSSNSWSRSCSCGAQNLCGWFPKPKIHGNKLSDASPPASVEHKVTVRSAAWSGVASMLAGIGHHVFIWKKNPCHVCTVVQTELGVGWLCACNYCRISISVHKSTVCTKLRAPHTPLPHIDKGKGRNLYQ